jgi:hypothetical protein
MRAKDQQGDFKLMQGLHIIQKKMYKETKSSRSRSRRSHYEKRREERSFDRHRSHFPKNSFMKKNSSSRSSPMRKHKRRIGVKNIQ